MSPSCKFSSNMYGCSILSKIGNAEYLLTFLFVLTQQTHETFPADDHLYRDKQSTQSNKAQLFLASSSALFRQ